VATPKEEINNYIWRWCEREGITLFKGSKNNVLKRYYDCAKRFESDPIIRITADCPFINPNIIKKLASLFKGKALMFDKRQGWGVEIFSFKDLEYMFKKYKFDEHVTTHLNPKIIDLPCQSVIPVELNTRQDYERICTLAPSYRA
jgi:spore coat polysaccharide biosynthesis protein SpsF